MVAQSAAIGLLRAVVDDQAGGALDEFGAAVADAEIGSADAADHPVRALIGSSPTT
jgi:hypothetical protein